MKVQAIAKHNTSIVKYLDPNSLSLNSVNIPKGTDIIGDFVIEQTNGSFTASVFGEKTTTIRLADGYLVDIHYADFDVLIINENHICRDCGGIGKESKAFINFHDIRTTDHTKEFYTKYLDCLKCSSCGHSWSPQKDKESALLWFGGLGSKKYELLKKYNISLDTQFTEGFKLRIVEMWKKECNNVQPIVEKKQVDFQQLNNLCEDIKNLMNINSSIKTDRLVDSINNLELFFELMSKSSTFAHKAHNELKKMNK